jgi:hypothetical protein
LDGRGLRISAVPKNANNPDAFRVGDISEGTIVNHTHKYLLYTEFFGSLLNKDSNSGSSSGTGSNSSSSSSSDDTFENLYTFLNPETQLPTLYKGLERNCK